MWILCCLYFKLICYNFAYLSLNSAVIWLYGCFVWWLYTVYTFAASVLLVLIYKIIQNNFFYLHEITTITLAIKLEKSLRLYFTHVVEIYCLLSVPVVLLFHSIIMLNKTIFQVLNKYLLSNSRKTSDTSSLFLYVQRTAKYLTNLMHIHRTQLKELNT